MSASKSEHSNNDILFKLQNKNLLFDFYGTLLTEKQRNIFTMSALEDCSFKEIGAEMGITPQAVADFLKRATLQLEKYEENLGLVNKFLSQKQEIKEIEAQLNKLDEPGQTNIAQIIISIKKSLEKLLI